MLPQILLALLGSAPAEWALFAAPGLCAPPAAVAETPALLAAAHLDLERDPRARRVEPREPALPQPVFVQMLEEHLRARNQRLELRPQADGLFARGEPAALQVARGLIGELDRQAAALDIDLVVTVRAAGRPDRSLRRRVRSGAEVFLGEREVRSFVAGFDVQVAADAGQAEPRIGAAYAGEGLHLRAARVSAGARVHLDGLYDFARVARVERFDPKTPDLGLFDQPVVELVQVAFAGTVASGAALEVELQDAGPLAGATRLSIQASARPDPGGADETWAVLDLAFVAARPRALEPVEPGTRLAGAARADDVAPAALTPSALAALLESERSSSDSRSPRAPIYWSDTLLAIPRADAARLEAARALVRAAEEPRAATLRVALQSGALRASIPATPGRPARLAVGVERPYVVDYALEVAPQIWMPAPIVESAFDGLVVELRAGRGTVHASASRSATAEVLVAERESGPIGRLQLLRRSHSAASGLASGPDALALFEGEGALSLAIQGP